MNLYYLLVLIILNCVFSMRSNLNIFRRSLNSESVNILIVSSPPGCGKTNEVGKFIYDSFKDGKYKYVIFIKKLVSERKFVDLSIYEKLCLYYKKEDLDYLAKTNLFKVILMKELYGFDFKNSIILVEDANRYKVNDLKLLMSKVDESCKLVITDSIKDKNILNLIKKVDKLRLKEYVESKLDRSVILEDNIKGLELGIDDIRRSNITKKIFNDIF